MRAQTTLDFLIGTAAFLLVVGLVIALVPGLLDPFAVAGSGDPVTANRAVSALAEDELADPSEPYILSDDEVQTFFALDESGVRDRLHVHPNGGINVTLENGTAIIDTVGPPIPEEQSVTTAWRSVSYQEEQAELTVRIW